MNEEHFSAPYVKVNLKKFNCVCYCSSNNPILDCKMESAIVGILIIVMTFTLTTARPQETTTEDSDSLLKENAQSNADGEHPLFLGYEEGFPNYQQGTEFAGGAEGTVYGGHGPEAGGVTGDIFNPGWTNGGGLSQNFPQQSQGPTHLLPPTHQNQVAPLFPNYEISPSPFSPQEGFPFNPEEESPTFPATHETSPLFENAPPLVAPIFEGNHTLQENNQTRPDSLIGSRMDKLDNQITNCKFHGNIDMATQGDINHKVVFLHLFREIFVE